MKCSLIVNVGSNSARLVCEPFEELDFFKFRRSRMAADGGCETDVIQNLNEFVIRCGEH